MNNTRETHPAWKHIDTSPDDSPEAKKKAGVTTHEQIMQRMENGSSECADAAMYIKMHKSILVPSNEVSYSLAYRKKDQRRTGWIKDKLFRFIDDDGNIAEVNINFDEISSINMDPGKFREEAEVRKFIEELEDYGFNIKMNLDNYEYGNKILEDIERHKREIEKESKEVGRKKLRF